jgi:hypothetical protein
MTKTNWQPVRLAIEACAEKGGTRAEQRAAGAAELTAQWGEPVTIVDRGGYWQVVRHAKSPR